MNVNFGNGNIHIADVKAYKCILIVDGVETAEQVFDSLEIELIKEFDIVVKIIGLA